MTATALLLKSRKVRIKTHPKRKLILLFLSFRDFTEGCFFGPSKKQMFPFDA